jgi:hypothetical protein
MLSVKCISEWHITLLSLRQIFNNQLKQQSDNRMPHNDLIGFKRLEPEAAAIGNASKRTAGSWAEAVDFLWKMPLPRVIQVTGGDTFEVFGGKGMMIIAAPRNADDIRLDTFCFHADKETPNIVAPQTWVDANPAIGYTNHQFDCLFVSGFAGYGGRRADVNQPLAFAQPNGQGLRVVNASGITDLDVYIFQLKVTQSANEKVEQRVASGGNGIIQSSGSVEAVAQGTLPLTIHRLTGDTRLTEGVERSGWNYMAYGWMIQSTADQKWLVLKNAVLPNGDVVLVGQMRYVGCFRDRQNDRAMEGNMKDIPVSNNQQVMMLSRHAALLGKRLFSVQAGNDKWLSDSDNVNHVTRHGDAARIGSGSCSSLDGGSNNAGGAYAMALYENTSEFVQFQQGLIYTRFGLVKHLGCWRDRGNDRIMSHKIAELGGNRDTVLDRATWYAYIQAGNISNWKTNGYFLVGIESGNQIYVPSAYEYANWGYWQRHGSMLGCDTYDGLLRPLGSPWGMSVYMVHLNETYNNILNNSPQHVSIW